MEFVIVLLALLSLGALVYTAYLGVSLTTIKREMTQMKAELQTLKQTRSTTTKTASSNATKVQPQAPRLVPQKQATPPPPSSPSKNSPLVNATKPTRISTTPPTISTKPLQTPIKPTLPKPLNPLINKLKSLNPLVLVGLVILLSGVSFMLKLAAQAGFFPLPLRMASAGFLGIGLLFTGWKFRLSKPSFALPLQGGAIGILFLVLFASYRIFGLLHPGIAFVCTLLVVILTSILAILQSSQVLALFAVISGFAAPIAMSSGSGNYVGLFSFYAILNIGIFVMAWYKSWRILNIVGFTFTYVIGTTWGVLKYNPQEFWNCELFLIFYYLLFSGVSVLFAQRTYKGVKGYVDGALVFALPIVTFSIQSALVEKDAIQLAYSAAFMALHYLCTSYYLFKKKAPGFKPMAESMMVMGILFGSLAVPLAFSGQWTTLAWSFEGAGLLWVGLRQKRLSSQCFGFLLLIGSSLFLLSATNNGLSSGWVILNPFILTSLCTAAATWVGAYLLHYFKPSYAKEGKRFLLVLSFINLLWPAFQDLNTHLQDETAMQCFFLWCSVFLGIQTLLSLKLKWRAPLHFIWPTLFSMIILSLVLLFEGSAPLKGIGWLVWPISIAITFFFLKTVHTLKTLPFQTVIHSLYFYTLPLLINLQVFEWVSPQNDVWSFSIVGILSISYLYLNKHLFEKRLLPQSSKSLFMGKGLYPALLFMALWSLLALASEAAAKPLPWIPILNPLDLASFSFLALFILLSKELFTPKLRKLILSWSLGLYTLAWTFTCLGRAVHHWADIRYSLSSIWASKGFHTSLSLLWTLLALGIMIWASKKHLRQGWISGAVLLGIIVAKLFLVDLSNGGSATRIISFIGVGLLILIVGYFSPLPPSISIQKDSHENS